MAKDYNFQYTPLTGRLPGKSFVKQTEQAINELAGIVNEGSAKVEVITNLANTANDNAEEALEKANEALETSGRVYITLPNLDDADDYFDSQLYYFANSYSANLPVQDTGFLEVKTNDTKTAAEQVFIADTTGLMYMRHGDITSTEVGDETVYSVTWETWSSALASENYVQGELLNYLPSSGGTITGNLDVTGAITGNSVTSNSVNVKSGSVAPVNTLQRSTAYSVDDIVYTSALNAKYYLLCVTAGTTSSVLPSLTNIAGGDVITDGTAEWEVQTITSEEKVDSGFFAKLVTNLAASTAATISSLNTNSLFYRMLSWALTASGVQYNFNNSSAWYICLGSLFGGLIIQGGYLSQQTGNYYYDVTLPISSYVRFVLLADADTPTITSARFDTSYSYGTVNTSKIRLACKANLESVAWFAMGT